MKINRNDPCPCGSGLKYKKCCLNKATESTTLNYAWHKMRTADNELSNLLTKHAVTLFGKGGLEKAWEEFYVFDINTPKIEDEDTVFIQAFMPWFLYNWFPENQAESPVQLPEVIAAEHYLKRYSSRLDAYQKAFIKANCEARYSIYEVTHVLREQSITLKDLLRGHQITIHEKMGSQTLERGHVLMARIVTINEDSIACGIYPQPLPSQCLLPVVEFKQYYAKTKFFSDSMLFELDLEIRGLYLDLVHELLENPFPKLQNTDGDEFSMNTISYTLTCTPQRAFEALAELAQNVDQSELAKDGIYNACNQLVEIAFPWCIAGNKMNKDWSNTVHGHITIKENTLTTEVNSDNRAQAVLIEINARLSTDEATYLHTTQKSIEELLKEPHEELNNPCDNSPEIQDLLKQMNHQHWVSWLDTLIPALNNVTPRQAAKTAKGRELLEALFVDFHNKNQSGFSQCPVDLHFLRKELGMT
ncbi:hypothetical protein TUM19329_36980 (plasmid) [Legionella antarctica]|uniref:SEC-C motif domain protein n=1 Tax=Legionella antarctica TaxID=2708020 RepID=A0A6F8TB47_9GAMM|nr:SEC-C domain-containing protein [Legionella antarctica]BCA97337.1 hypothetical protein TUM19329_36980 [Legionella antarctica]